ncbi:MAG: formylglycine-generating enzyme family protein [Bacteroidota bacterium]
MPIDLPSDKEGMVLIPNGILHMGGDNDQADANEYPKHNVEISEFYMDITELTNEEFKEFVDSTGYKTLAERKIEWEELAKNLPQGTPRVADSLLMPGSLVFKMTDQPVRLDDYSQWWKWTIGANWQNVTGDATKAIYRPNHPVVHVAWEDANAYCKWKKKRLPTEAEWEWAARGGHKNVVYPWGSNVLDESQPKANFWQGLFPFQNSEKDGYLLTAPVKSYDPNGYGLYDMAGNVWEYCSDWFDYSYYQKNDAVEKNTKGPNRGYNPMNPYQQEKVIRGGSFLCNDSYCSGYRNARRMGTSTDTGLSHTGFRCVCSK